MTLISFISIPITTRTGIHYLRLDLNTNYLYFKKDNDYVLIEDLYQYAQEINNSIEHIDNQSIDDDCCCGHDHNEIQNPQYILELLSNQIMNKNISESEKKNLQNVIDNINKCNLSID